jgi:16S rRNA (cytosine1402-N4)-methyltransferase
MGDVSAIQHQPIMQHEVCSWLMLHAPSVVVDCTLGGGGHTRALLQASDAPCLVIGLDRDPACIAAAAAWGEGWGERFVPLHGNFRDLPVLLAQLGISHVDAVLFDLGMSSYQVDTAARGFSVYRDGPLDMRMDPTQSYTACMLVNQASQDELRSVMQTFGEERWADRIAQMIVSTRRQTPITRTRTLADLVARAIPRAAWPAKLHPATKTFQALRMAVNDELGALQDALPHAVTALRPRGRLGVLAFHSLEDRVVKRFMRQEARGCVCPPRLPQCVCGQRPRLKILTRRPLVPAPEEIHENPRSRSARLRVAEKLTDEE